MELFDDYTDARVQPSSLVLKYGAMSKFILFDHTLTGLGGHNFQYAHDILCASEDLGYEPVLVANQGFDGNTLLDKRWQVITSFKRGTNPQYRMGVDGKSKRALDHEGRALSYRSLFARFSDSMTSRRRALALDSFADGCEQALEAVGYDRRNIMFMPTMYDFEVLGLVRLLRRNMRAAELDWHIQFHFDILPVPVPHRTSRALMQSQMRDQFAAAGDAVPHSRLHFYGTTETMAQQYSSIGLTDVEVLPYPVSIERVTTDPTCTPRRISVGGMLRREKGKRQLQAILDSLRSELEAGIYQVALQSNPQRLKRLLPRDLVNRVAWLDHASQASDAPVVAMNYPLESDKYRQFIRQSHIGLFPYDCQRYRARCSGVLLEMLCAGIPVVVPAGSWLASQIEPCSTAHHQMVRDDSQLVSDVVIDGLDIANATERFPRLASTITFGGIDQAVTTSLFVPQSANEMLVTLAGNNSPEQTCHALLQIDQFNELGRRCETHHSVLQVDAKHTSTALVHLHDHATRVSFSLSNAFLEHEVSLDSMHAEFLHSERSIPRSNAGLTYVDVTEATQCIHEINLHYEHYRAGVAQYASQWRVLHAPERTVDILQARQQAQMWRRRVA